MRDEQQDVQTRMDAAKAAAPFVHPRLSAIEYTDAAQRKPVEEMTDEELMRVAKLGTEERALKMESH
jgi:hypothetical protein